MRTTPTHHRTTPQPPHGSVLVFAVVILSVLTMLAVAFLIVTRHAVNIARSSNTSMAADLVSEAAQLHAQRWLHDATSDKYIYTDSGVFNYTPGSPAQTLPTVVAAVDPKYFQSTLDDEVVDGFTRKAQSHTSNSPLTKFVYEPYSSTGAIIPEIGKVSPPFAVLSAANFDFKSQAYDYVDPHFNQPPLSNQIPSETNPLFTPYYSIAPMRTTQTFTEVHSGVSYSPLRATGTYLASNVEDFYYKSPGDKRVLMSKPFGIQGRYFVWVRDLDACFNANPATWGVDVGSVAANNTIKTDMLNYLINTPATSFTDLMTPTEITDFTTKMTGLTASTTFDNIGTFAQTFERWTRTTPATDFQLWRSGLEAYFSPCSFTPSTNMAANLKPNPGAININTAPEEVIQAMLSQIPYDATHTFSTFEVPGAPNINNRKPVLSELLAKRILAKRPFLCRMDFEDFAATLLPGTPYDPTDLAYDPNDKTGKFDLKQLNQKLSSEIQAIQWALERRVTRSTGEIEIPLASYLEMTGIEEVPAFKDANKLARIKERFYFFLKDNDVHNEPMTTALRANCPLTVKAFNNLLNSVSTCARSGLDAASAQKMAYGATGTPSDKVLDFGVVAPSSYILGGDDVLDAGNNCVYAGPDGKADSVMIGFSYYSHDYVPPDYKPIRLKATQPTMNEAYCINPINVGKFIYGVTSDLAPIEQTDAAADKRKSYSMADLRAWSCVGNGQISGTYDLFFNFNDVMIMELGEQVPPPNLTPDFTKPSVISSTTPATPLRTGTTQPSTTDIQVIPPDSTVLTTDIVLVLPKHSNDVQDGKLMTAPNAVNTTIPQSPGTPPTPGDDLVVQAIRLSPTHSTTIIDPLPKEDYIHTGVDGYRYIVPLNPKVPLKTVLGEPDPNNANPNDVDKFVEVIVDGGDGKCSTSVQNDDLFLGLGTPTETIGIGRNQINESFVWGPIRASQRPQDTGLQSNAAQLPTISRDVAWSPQFSYRSRFYMIYTLAQGLKTKLLFSMPANVTYTASATYPPSIPEIEMKLDPPGSGSPGLAVIDTAGNPQARRLAGHLFVIREKTPGPTYGNVHVYPIDDGEGNDPAITQYVARFKLSVQLDYNIQLGDELSIHSVKVSGERRIETAYDALNDEVLFKRSPQTEKRSLGEP